VGSNDREFSISGWVICYLLAGYLTSPFFGPLFAGSTATLKWDFFTLLGGMVFWVAGVVW
jgi:hypothetical protein